MDLNDKIKKQNSLIESLNSDIDSLLNEQINYLSNLGTAIKIVGKVVGAIPKGVYKKGMDFISKKIEDHEKEVEELEKEEDESNTIDIDELLAKIEQLELLASSLEEKKEESLKYKRVVIDFKKKTKLDILSMKSPEFKRNLMGTMYFKVLDINEDEKYMILKTSGYSRIDESLFFKLEYKGLETYKDQKGDINLIYSRHRNPSINPVEGEIEDCYYRIIQLK